MHRIHVVLRQNTVAGDYVQRVRDVFLRVVRRVGHFPDHGRVQYPAVGETRGHLDGRRYPGLVRFQFVVLRPYLAQRMDDNRMRYRRHARVGVWQRNLRVLRRLRQHGTVPAVRYQTGATVKPVEYDTGVLDGGGNGKNPRTD